MTEFEINKAVAEKLGMKFPELIDKDSYKPLTYFTEDGNDILSFDPCNNVEQAWEIMIKYNICVTKEYSGEYVAFDGLVVNSVDDANWFHYETHPKPLVAAMLCFLEL